jgi:hypothetical protein
MVRERTKCSYLFIYLFFLSQANLQGELIQDQQQSSEEWSAGERHGHSHASFLPVHKL